MRTIPQISAGVTGNLPVDSTVCRERIIRRARAAADEFIRRDAGNIAVRSGIKAHTVSREREILEDQVPTLAKVALYVKAGRELGRTAEEVNAFLAPIHEAAAIDPQPIIDETNTVGVGCAAANALRAVSALVARAIEAMADGEMTQVEYDELEPLVNAERTHLARMLREMQAAVTNKPLRGKAFTQPTKSRT